jgi:hypothetical protein
MENSVSTQTATARSFALRLTLDAPLGLAPELGRLAAGLGLSAFYGLALGARAGGAELLKNGLGVPLGLLVLGVVMMPSLTVLFAILDAPVTPARVLSSLARALSAVGLMLAGLAPGAALLSVTVESPELAVSVARYGFLLAGGLGLLGLCVSLGRALNDAELWVARKGQLFLLGYGVFAVVLATRLWTAFVPMLGGAS